MARLASLAAARARPLWPALRRPLPQIPLRRASIAATIATAILGLGYYLARETPLFAVEDIAVTGAPGVVHREVRTTLADLEGTSLVKLDASGLEQRLQELPSVVDAHVDRSFPHTLRILVNHERPLAVVTNQVVSWVVSRRGRVIRASESGAGVRLPRIRSASASRLVPGHQVVHPQALVPLRALAGVPAGFPVRIRSARNGSEGLTLVLAGGTELRLGTAEDVDRKLAAARAVLSSLRGSERRALAYLDVTLPHRPVSSEG